MPNIRDATQVCIAPNKQTTKERKKKGKSIFPYTHVKKNYKIGTHVNKIQISSSYLKIISISYTF